MPKESSTYAKSSAGGQQCRSYCGDNCIVRGRNDSIGVSVAIVDKNKIIAPSKNEADTRRGELWDVSLEWQSIGKLMKGNNPGTSRVVTWDQSGTRI